MGELVDPEAAVFVSGPRCASIDGVSLQANVAVPARDRCRLERLCRYVARLPVSTQRLSRLDDGRLLYRLKRRWRDGKPYLMDAVVARTGLGADSTWHPELFRLPPRAAARSDARV